MLGIRCTRLEAEQTKKALIEQEVLLTEYKVLKKDGFVIFPVREVVEGMDVVEETFTPIGQTKSFREAVKEILSEEELEHVKASYDNIGGIAIIEIDESLRTKEKELAELLLKTTPNISTVVRKEGGHEGELRLQQYKYLAGKKTYEAITTENGVRLELDIRKTYYSPRSSTERLRIASLVQDGERVLVMFSGIAPFPLVIEKQASPSEVIGIELNKEAHKHAQNNLELNKSKKIQLYWGDVRDVVPTVGVFDRIVMPLPHTASDFLDVALSALKKNGMIHLYDFCSEGEAGEKAEGFPSRLENLGSSGCVVHVERCGALGPGMYRWCYDIQLKG